MVKESRIIVGMMEVAAIRLECGKCGTIVQQGIGRQEMPDACPSCNQSWDNGKRRACNELLTKFHELEVIIGLQGSGEPFEASIVLREGVDAA